MPPRLTQARIEPTREVLVTDELGHVSTLRVPIERALTLYVDKAEVVTLMTLGAHPEWLVIGYLLNQRLVESVGQIESVTVDWQVGAAAVKTLDARPGAGLRDTGRIVTTGCGQGSMFADLLGQLAPLRDSPPATLRQSQLLQILDTVRLRDTVYKAAGSVHACALFEGERLQVFIEDVGRHNALDSIAGWLTLDGSAHDPAPVRTLYTTGRLTSEMIIKAAQMGVPIVVSRSGVTEMGLDVALEAGVCAIGRAINRRFLCYTHPERLIRDSAGQVAGAPRPPQPHPQ